MSTWAIPLLALGGVIALLVVIVGVVLLVQRHRDRQDAQYFANLDRADSLWQRDWIRTRDDPDSTGRIPPVTFDSPADRGEQ